MKVKEVRRQMSDVRRWEEERKCEKTERQFKSDLKPRNENSMYSIKSQILNDGYMYIYKEK